MDVIDTARDTVYATIGFTAITAQQLQTQAKKARGQFEERRKARLEKASDLVKAAREQLQTHRSQMQSQVADVVGKAKDRLGTFNLNGNLDAIEERLPEQLRTGLDQLRTQVADLADTVRENAQKLVGSAA